MAQAQDQGITVVSGLPDEVVGAIEYWICSGTLNLDRLTSAWEAAGLDSAWLPSKPTLEKAMSLAVNTQKDCRRGNKRRVLVSPMRGITGWVLVEQMANGEEVTHSVDCKVKVEDGQLKIDPSWHPLAFEIARDFDQAQKELDAATASHWLVRMVERFKSVPLKQSAGSFYFVPKGERDKWREIVTAVKVAQPGYSFHEIPALPSDQVAAAVLDAVAAEAEAEAANLTAALDSDEIGSRGLLNRVTICDRVLGKVSLYEGIIGGKLDHVRSKMDELKVALVNAALTAEAKEDAEKAARALPNP